MRLHLVSLRFSIGFNYSKDVIMEPKVLKVQEQRIT